jgi:hypothetical protein
LVLLRYARVGLWKAHGEHAMITVMKFLKAKFSRQRHMHIDDYLLCDIGLSPIIAEYRGS